MGITDKVTGRIKQAAGDLTGSESLRREGVQEERKGQAKDDLVREELRAEEERVGAAEARERAQQKAETAAERELERGEIEAADRQKRADQAEVRADQKADEVAQRERTT